MKPTYPTDNNSLEYHLLKIFEPCGLPIPEQFLRKSFPGSDIRNGIELLRQRGWKINSNFRSPGNLECQLSFKDVHPEYVKVLNEFERRTQEKRVTMEPAKDPSSINLTDFERFKLYAEQK